MQQKNTVIILIIIIIVAVVVGGLYVVYPDLFKGLITREPSKIEKKQPKVVQEELVIPETKEITAGQGRTVEEGNVQVSLVPKDEGEKVIVPKAVLTVKGAHNLASAEAKKWSADAKLVFVKSLGAVTLEGKSSQWQLAFSSAAQKSKGYEVIIQADQIASKREIDSTATGADVPANLNDSDVAVQTLAEMPQFSDATISTINLYYNADGKIWRYALSTSKGTTSVLAQ